MHLHIEIINRYSVMTNVMCGKRLVEDQQRMQVIAVNDDQSYTK